MTSKFWLKNCKNQTSGCLGGPFYFTKSIILTLKFLGTTAVLLLPIFLASSIKPFSGDLPCDKGHEWIVYHYAAVIHAESRGEGREGMIATLSALRNGACGYKVGKLDPEIVELVVREMEMPITHRYRHFINFRLASDRRQIRIARRSDGIQVGNHFFY